MTDITRRTNNIGPSLVCISVFLYFYIVFYLTTLETFPEDLSPLKEQQHCVRYLDLEQLKTIELNSINIIFSQV